MELYPLDDCDDALFKEQYRQSCEAGYEERMVVALLKHFHLESYMPVLKAEAANHSTDDFLTFPVFLNYFSSFPVHIGTRHIPFLHEVPLGTILKSPTKTKIWKAFEDFLEAEESGIAENTNIGMIFNWPEIGNVILHNMDIQVERGFAISWSGLPNLCSEIERNELQLNLFNRRTKTLVADSGAVVSTCFLDVIGQLWNPE